MSDEQLHAIEEARAAVGAAVARFIELLVADDYPGDPAYVQAWAVSVEYTNAELLQSHKGGRAVIVPDDQLVATSLGLGDYLRAQFR